MSKQYFGLLGGLQEITDIVKEHDCSWEEAHRIFRERYAPPVESNVIYYDFGKAPPRHEMH